MIEFIVLQTLEGANVYINREAIISMRTSHPDKEKRLITDKAHCVITLADGKFLTVAEECDNIRQRLKELRKE